MASTDPAFFESPAFYNVVRHDLFDGRMSQSQVDGLRHIGSFCLRADLFTEEMAYVLASIFHETGKKMSPVRETFATTDEDAIARLDHAWKRGQLPWVSKPYWAIDRDGKSWFGRGHIQLTHKENYLKQQDKLKAHHLRGEGVPYAVADDPSLALNPDTSVMIAVLGMKDGDFTGNRLSDHIRPGYANYLRARRIVNGMDRAVRIAGYAHDFERAIRAAGNGA